MEGSEKGRLKRNGGICHPQSGSYHRCHISRSYTNGTIEIDECSHVTLIPTWSIYIYILLKKFHSSLDNLLPPPPTHTQMHSSLNCRVIIFYQVKLTQQYIGASFIKLFFNVDLKLTIHISSWANLYWLLLIIQSYYYCQLSPTSQQSFFFSSAELCLKAKPKLSWS